jgi:hypothetical protein
MIVVYSSRYIMASARELIICNDSKPVEQIILALTKVRHICCRLLATIII